MFSLFFFFSFFFLPFLTPRPVIAQTSRLISITSPSQNLTVHDRYYDFNLPTATPIPVTLPPPPTNTPILPSNTPVPSSPTPSPSPSAEMTVTDFWNGNAELKFAFKITNNSLQSLPGINAGVHMEVIGNTWYLFTRKVDWGNKPSYCPNNETMHLQVRKSTDYGKTWSQQVDVIGNTPNTPYECAATDGDAFYNQSENRWHYLFQCLDRRGLWSGCHAERFGLDPFGPFTPVPENPVINPGDLWSKICDSTAKDCFTLSRNTPVNNVVDEGTFDIFFYQSGYYLVGFHGYDGINGYRTVMKTPDFKNWEIVAPDAILDKKDALQFNTPWDQSGPIGFGAGKIIKDKDYYYQFSEAADKNLGCTPQQNWVLGLFRSQNLASTDWQQLPQGNPFFTINNFPVVEANPLPCYPSYPGLFTSQSGKTYFHTSMSSYNNDLDGIYFYTLEPKNNSTPAPPSPTPIPFDFNTFLSLLKTYYNQTNPPSSVDLNHDGRVDIFDYNALLQNFGK